MILLFGAALLLSAGPRDTMLVGSVVATPTISHTPVVGIRSSILADSIVVEKSKRTLTLFEAGLPVRTYRVALGTQPVGDKVRMGDGRTPEGTYFIDYKNPQSKYHKALHISYPDAAHAQRAKALGASPGGDIMIHGLPPAYAKIGADQANYNWTEGCIAVTDQEIEEIWSAIPMGALIHIKP
jgi:murein L,D-transpeptidase YafK